MNNSDSDLLSPRWHCGKASASRVAYPVPIPSFPRGAFAASSNTSDLTSKANAQTIHIRHTYRTCSQSSSLLNQPSRTFELPHTNLQHNDYFLKPVTSSEHRGHINWNQTLDVTVFSIIPSLKQIGSQMS